MRHPLARALDSAGMDTAETATRLAVDPKTVGRWLAGRVPYPRNRAALEKLTGWTARDLWPELAHPAAAEPAGEVEAVYSHCAALPVDMWRRLVLHAETEVSIATDNDLSPTEEVLGVGGAQHRCSGSDGGGQDMTVILVRRRQVIQHVGGARSSSTCQCSAPGSTSA